MNPGAIVIHKRSRRTGTVVSLVDCSKAPILYTRNTRGLRALVQWADGSRTAMLVSALQLADEETTAANRAAIHGDAVAHWRRELASAEQAIRCYEERGEMRYAESARRRADRYRAKLEAEELAARPTTGQGGEG